MQEQYSHQAVPYAGEQQFLSCCAAMADRAAARDEQLMFLVDSAKLDALRDTLGSPPDDVSFVELDEHASNPALLITLLDGLRSTADGRRCVTVHEPSQDGPSAARAETRLGESVLNSPSLNSWNLAVLCLYNSADLDAAALGEMRRTHPSVWGEDGNPAYEPHLADIRFSESLPAVPGDAIRHQLHGRDLASAREFVRGNAEGLAPDRREDLVLAANEVITNSIQHADGQCQVAMWDEGESVVCDVRDNGHITDPLVGRLAPRTGATAGRGLWLANHLCDLVQIRSSQAGTTVRLRIGR
jgi:anti-sigma regulatory factor (Ser/Thr protein kinase)